MAERCSTPLQDICKHYVKRYDPIADRRSTPLRGYQSHQCNSLKKECSAGQWSGISKKAEGTFKRKFLIGDTDDLQVDSGCLHKSASDIIPFSPLA